MQRRQPFRSPRSSSQLVDRAARTLCNVCNVAGVELTQLSRSSGAERPDLAAGLQQLALDLHLVCPLRFAPGAQLGEVRVAAIAKGDRPGIVDHVQLHLEVA